MSNASNISNYSEIISQSNNRHFAQTPALTQGDKYKRYQQRIRQSQMQDSKMQDMINVQSKSFEGFSLLTTSKNNYNDDNSGMQLTRESNTIIDKNRDYLSSQQQILENVKQEYAKTLEEYKHLEKTISRNANQYIERVNPNNPYLNKTIRFTSGETAYVTNKGVVKLIPSQKIWTSSGAPKEFVQLDIAWNSDETKIPTTPPLVIGTPLEKGQSIGNEGGNVFVNTILNNSDPTYSGCYADKSEKRAVNFIGDTPSPITNLIKNENFTEPKLKENSWKMYADNSNKVANWIFNAWLVTAPSWGYPVPYPNGTQCACIQNDQYISQIVNLSANITYNLSFFACGRNCCDDNGVNPVNIIISNTDNSNPIIIYAIQPVINEWTNYTTTFTVPTAQNYLLTFKGTWTTSDRSTALQTIQLSTTALSSGGTYTWADCKAAAINQGYRFFGLQSVNSTTSTGYCAVSNSEPTATKYGNSYIPTEQVVLWSSNISNTDGQSGNYAQLSQNGSLSVINSGGQSVFNTSNSSANPGNYLGCYGDQSDRAIPMLNADNTLSTLDGGDRWDIML